MEHAQSSPPELLLHYCPGYSILICKVCCYAIQPAGIARHLKDIHHIYRSHRRPYMEFASRFKLADPKDIISKEAMEFPVPRLPTFDGLQCLSADNCQYLCVSVKRMQKHWLSVHGRHGSPGSKDWRPAPLQTMFRGNLLHYFTSPQLRAVTHADTWNSAITDILNKLDVLDQKLLHHYLTCTAQTLADAHGTQEIWHQVIPQMARKEPFLMHAMLACSALHLAHTSQSNPTYLTRAHQHQETAMPLFRHAIAAVSKTNCHSILAFSHLLVIYSFAAGRPEECLLLINTDTASQGPNLMSSWLYFIRNGCLLLCDFWDDIEAGPLSSLAQCWERPIADCAVSTKSRITSHLLGLVRTVVETNEIDTAMHIYQETAEQLGSAIGAAQMGMEMASTEVFTFTTWDIVRVWPMQLSPAYLELLAGERPTPAALILLVHYCFLLAMAEPRWYLENLAEGLFCSVVGRLDRLGPPGSVGVWRRRILQSFKEIEGLLSLSLNIRLKDLVGGTDSQY